MRCLTFIALLLAASASPQAEAQVLQSRQQADGSKRVTLRLSELFRAKPAAATDAAGSPSANNAPHSHPMAANPQLAAALECKARDWRVFETMIRDEADIPIPPTPVYGLSVTSIFATIETEAPEWGFVVPASAVSALIRKAGLKPNPEFKGAYLRHFDDGSILLAPQPDGRWHYSCHVHGPQYD